MANWRLVRPLRILAYDVENKPGTYGGGDYTFPKLTALGAQFVDDPPPRGWILKRDDKKQMLRAAAEFREMWEEADIVMGHNIRRHDEKLLTGFYTALDLEPLPKRRMIDTYLDQPKMAGYSRSLENLADRWGCPVKKMRLSEWDWERAYDGLPEGEELMRRRVCSDVQISVWLWKELNKRELLKW